MNKATAMTKKRFFLATLLIALFGALVPYPFALPQKENKEKVALFYSKGASYIPEEFGYFLTKAISEKYTIAGDGEKFKCGNAYP
jgi:hypothetical protein